METFYTDEKNTQIVLDLLKKHGIKKEQFLYKFFEFYAKLFSLGDTFEIYAIKK